MSSAIEFFAEKCLKALLAAREVPFPKTHDLRVLARLASPPLALEPDDEALVELSYLAVAARYPGEPEDVPPEVAARAPWPRHARSSRWHERRSTAAGKGEPGGRARAREPRPGRDGLRACSRFSARGAPRSPEGARHASPGRRPG